jgi:putative solute:sodium symporter small subunit
MNRRDQYWKRNLRYLAVLLAVWFMASFGCGILFVDSLDAIRVAGFKLGFWFAQQGAILIFVVLIVVYVRLMNRLDREFQVHEPDDAADGASRIKQDPGAP